MYGNPFNSLRVLCRLMLGGWLVLVIAASAVVGYSTRTEHSANLLTFLFARSAPLPRLPHIAVTPSPAPTPAPPVAPIIPAAPVPVVADPVTPAPSLWQPLPRGRGKGSGKLEAPVVTTLPDGRIQIIFAYKGAPGQVTSFRAANIRSLSIDLHGAWKVAGWDKRFTGNSVLSRLQIAQHDGFVRLSGIDRADGKRPLQEETTFSPTEIRVLFYHEAEG